MTRTKLKGNPVDASLARLAPLPICLKLAWKDCDSTASNQPTLAQQVVTSDSHQDSALCKLCPERAKSQTPTCRPKHNLLPERGSVPVSASWPPTLTTHAQMSDHKKPRNSSPKFSKRSKQSLVMCSQSMSTGSGEHLSHTPHKSSHQGLPRTTFCDASAVWRVVSSLSKYFPCFQKACGFREECEPKSWNCRVDPCQCYQRSAWNMMDIDGWQSSEPLWGAS